MINLLDSKGHIITTFTSEEDAILFLSYNTEHLTSTLSYESGMTCQARELKGVCV